MYITRVPRVVAKSLSASFSHLTKFLPALISSSANWRILSAWELEFSAKSDSRVSERTGGSDPFSILAAITYLKL